MRNDSRWIGSWVGGRVREGVRGKVFWIERQHERHRYRIRLAGCSEAQAAEEYLQFKADPKNYRPPAERRELAEIEAEEAEIERLERERDAARLVLTDKLIEAFAEALSKGYGSREPASKHHVFVCDSFLRAWAEHPDVKGRDVRTVTLREWRAALESGETVVGEKRRPWASLKHRIVALRSFTHWLRFRGELQRSEDTTLDLAVPQARRPTATERAERVYTVDELQRTYAALASQSVRDLFWVRLHTGLHESEIERIARGHAVIRKVTDPRIAAVVEVRHKSGRDHLQSVDGDTLVRIERLMARKEWIGEKTLARHRASAAATSGCREIYLGNLRHTRTTLLEQLGREVLPAGMRGVPLDRVARSHGHSHAIAAAHYSGAGVPPLLVVPVRLRHPEDPS